MRWLFWIPFVPGTFIFYGLYHHATPFDYYYGGAFIMALCGAVSMLIWTAPQ